MSKRVIMAVYPGTFDPITYGHIDIIMRGSRLFDVIVVALLHNPEKKCLFSLQERRQMILKTVGRRKNIKVDTFAGLLINYVRRIRASVVVRGLRAISDFEYEFQMALMNRKMAKSVETVFMMPSEEYSCLSSKLLKEIAFLGGDISAFVPKEVERRMKLKIRSLSLQNPQAPDA